MTEKPQNKAAHGKRKRVGKAARIALCSPYETFRPLLNEVQTRKIHELLKSLLHAEKEKTKLPWKKLIKLTKAERKNRIRALNENSVIPEELQKQRKSVKFGLNSVARAILHCQLSSCLLAEDVEPDILINHIVSLAVTRGIPVLIVPKLKKITRGNVGFPSVALGIMAKEENHYLKPLDGEISSIFSEFPPSWNHASFLKKNENTPAIRKKQIVSNKIKEKIKTCSANSETNNKQLPNSESKQLKFESLDFISINTEPDLSKIVTTQPRIDLTSVYMCPKFKRVSKNPNKLKKKKKKNVKKIK